MLAIAATLIVGVIAMYNTLSERAFVSNTTNNLNPVLLDNTVKKNRIRSEGAATYDFRGGQAMTAAANAVAGLVGSCSVGTCGTQTLCEQTTGAGCNGGTGGTGGAWREGAVGKFLSLEEDTGIGGVGLNMGGLPLAFSQNEDNTETAAGVAYSVVGCPAGINLMMMAIALPESIALCEEMTVSLLNRKEVRAAGCFDSTASGYSGTSLPADTGSVLGLCL